MLLSVSTKSFSQADSVIVIVDEILSNNLDDMVGKSPLELYQNLPLYSRFLWDTFTGYEIAGIVFLYQRTDDEKNDIILSIEFEEISYYKNSDKLYRLKPIDLLNIKIKSIDIFVQSRNFRKVFGKNRESSNMRY
ncbi:MAG: hypothetical protein ACI85I_000695 [Arenicella sp.]|jgi:hypothetical protein